MTNKTNFTFWCAMAFYVLIYAPYDALKRLVVRWHYRRYRRAYNKAISKADKLAKETGNTHYVAPVGFRFVIGNRNKVRRLVLRHQKLTHNTESSWQDFIIYRTK